MKYPSFYRSSYYYPTSFLVQVAKRNKTSYNEHRSKFYMQESIHLIIFSTLILISFVLYIYYKVMVVKTKDPLLQEHMNSKARIFLGIFIFFFGINQYLFYETRLSLFIGIIFIILGAFQFRLGIKSKKHYQNEYKKHRQ
ncbi:YtpI family protein [Halobacillus seohaensis]|uniref:YtpI family protein n=1 Tax=Halobacillus seohaensis TaxID=447421 RepID=A0ABW2EKI6_9BACI